MTAKGNFDFLYNPIKEKMRELVSHINYTTFIEKLVPVDVDGRYIVLEAPSESFAKYITTTLADKMREAIAEAGVGIIDFRLKVEGADGYVYNGPEEENKNFNAPTNLDPKFTFESFVVGPNNEYVFAAAQSVADDPAGTYNPLFIYGGTGLGKTHLMQAIANKIVREKPYLKVIYITCEQFVNEIIDTMFTSRGADTRDKGSKLRQHYRSADVLIVDDIQFIENKKAVQEEFFHTFNELVAKGKQIVISSDHSPKELVALEERLRTRFSGGLLFDILPPDYETKVAILKRKAFEKKCVVPDDVLNFLAKDSGDDVRTLEGRLTKVIFASRLHEEPITVQLARSALSEAVPEDGNEEITPETVINAVTGFYHIEKSDITGKSKKKEVVIPRQICCYLMCELLSLPLVSIGKELGGRDHTTMLYSRDKVEEMCRTNDRIAKDVDDIKNIILKK
ncbi:MAG TPA: chromosomal replication initiator protein DnaA [Candidatus Coproplasma stercoripullorum]|mgnify:FL=1|uniref:Chromosomal replication initiator protein DnaA n=1 Tax=Candidatus Coproplasma stercoripullorum TaxID=2840751 RepID=A0A9D1AFP2_9FIRM|nr:chromosomal replication initiator protein DnaA [Candidatus Coproplasma stercoripullorum]